ncbi:MAG: hypothetical protein ACI8TX_000661 [Hyphomicrobiaceae bacterium]|jgi:hypothetical protein
MKTMIDTYQSFPGEHCGSVAMRGLLNHYCDLQLPEAAVFGLGSGVDSVLIANPSMNPAVVLFGRTATMEIDLGSALGIDYREVTERDDNVAWQMVRDEVIAGRPTMLSGDIFYLDYREFTVHFPGHRFVLVGFDDESHNAFIADRVRPEAETCSYAALATSRNPTEGMSTHNLWGRFHSTKPERSLSEASRFAIDRTVRRMLSDSSADLGSLAGADTRVVTGVAGTRAFANEVRTWGEREDRAWLASYNARCIEKFGNGGGNFRRMYAGFLEWTRTMDPSLVPDGAAQLAVQAADGWTAVADILARAAEDGASIGLFEEAARGTSEVADLEQRLFETLGSVSAP